MVTVKIDDHLMRDKLGQLHDALIGAGKTGDAATMIQDEGRLFLRQVINLTPPSPGMGGAAKELGENAIKRDLRKIFTPVELEFLNANGAQNGTNIHFWFTNKKNEKVSVKFDRVDSTGGGMKDFHRKNIDRRGHARNIKKSGQTGTASWYAPYVITHEAFADYRDKILARVGSRKAAWGVGFTALGGKLQSWIQRHVGRVTNKTGIFVDQLTVPNRPSFTVANLSPGIADDERIVRDAMRIRQQAIGRKIKGILAGYSNDWKRGLKIQKQERKKSDE